jgi:excisionase family DNA binding protein
MSTKTVPNTDKLLRVPAVQERLALSRSAAYALIESGKLPSVRLPGSGSRFHRRVRESDLENFITSNLVGAAQQR